METPQNQVSKWHSAPPEGLLRARYRTLYLEPVPGSGERIAALVAVSAPDGINIKRIVPREALASLFGSGSAFIEQLLENTLAFYREHGTQVEDLPLLHGGMEWGPTREAATTLGLQGIFRQALSRCSAFGSIEEELQEDSEVNQAREGVYFAKRIRDAVLARNAQLGEYFNQEVPVIPQGVPVRFGFIKHRAFANFEVLRVYNRHNSVKAAQGRLWQLLKAKRHNAADQAWLVLGRPPVSSVEHSEQQLQDITRWVNELTQEAAGDGVTVKPVESIDEARDTVIELAAAA